MSLLGIDQAQKELENKINQAHEALDLFPELKSSELINLARYVMERES